MFLLFRIVLVIALLGQAWSVRGRNDFMTQPRIGYPSACLLPPQSGTCWAYFTRHYYDPIAGTCKVFVYGGCNNNGNNFHSYHQCMEVCGGVTATYRF